MTGRWRRSDVRTQLLATTAGVVVGAIAGEIAGEPWPGVVFFGCIFIANGMLKWLQPSNTVLSSTSWAMFILSASVALVGLHLLANSALLGGWTIVVVFALFFVYGLVSLIVSARTSGDANSMERDDDGAD